MSVRVFRCYRQWVWLVLAWLVLGIPAVAETSKSLHQRVDGIDIYLGVVPAEMIRGHPKEHPESEMHGGVPVGMYHVMVALFERTNGRRITDAVVTARMVWPDQYSVKKRLDPMIVSASPAYGNYFRVPERGAVRIDLQIRRPGQAAVVHATFHWAAT